MRRVAVVLAVALLATSCSGDDGSPFDTLAEFLPVSSEPANDAIYLLPADRTTIRSAQIGEISMTEDDAGSVVLLGRPHDDGVDDRVTVAVISQATDREVASSEDFESVDINGSAARLSVSALAASIDWHVDGRAINVLGPAVDAELVEAVAGQVVAAGTGAGIVPDPPGGLVILDAATTPGIDWSGFSFSVLLEEGVLRGATPLPGFSTLYQLVPGVDSLTWIDLRGGRAAWSARAIPQLEEYDYGELSDEQLTQYSLAWLERPDLVVSLSAPGPLADVVALAESLEVVERLEFDSFQSLRDAIDVEPAD